MTTYRTGNHWGVTIVREPNHGGDCFETCNGHTDAQLVAVVVNGDQALAERICALLNGVEPKAEGGWPLAKPYRIYSRWVRGLDYSRRAVYAAIREAYAVGLASGAPPASTAATTGNPRCGWCDAEGSQCTACADRDGPGSPLSSPLSASGAELVGQDPTDGLSPSEALAADLRQVAAWNRGDPAAIERAKHYPTPPAVPEGCGSEHRPVTDAGAYCHGTGATCPRHGTVI